MSGAGAGHEVKLLPNLTPPLHLEISGSPRALEPNEPGKYLAGVPVHPLCRREHTHTHHRLTVSPNPNQAQPVGRSPFPPFRLLYPRRPCRCESPSAKTFLLTPCRYTWRERRSLESRRVWHAPPLSRLRAWAWTNVLLPTPSPLLPLSPWSGAPRRGSQTRFSQGDGDGGAETHVRYLHILAWPGLACRSRARLVRVM